APPLRGHPVRPGRGGRVRAHPGATHRAPRGTDRRRLSTLAVMAGSKKRSAGILLFRLSDARLEVFIAHMGGPFWANKDEGGWSIVMGEYEDGEDPYEAARREHLDASGSVRSTWRTMDMGAAVQ